MNHEVGHELAHGDLGKAGHLVPDGSVEDLFLWHDGHDELHDLLVRDEVALGEAPLLDAVDAALATILDHADGASRERTEAPEVDGQHQCPQFGDIPAACIVSLDEALVGKVAEDLSPRGGYGLAEGAIVGGVVEKVDHVFG